MNYNLIHKQCNFGDQSMENKRQFYEYLNRSETALKEHFIRIGYTKYVVRLLTTDIGKNPVVTQISKIHTYNGQNIEIGLMPSEIFDQDGWLIKSIYKALRQAEAARISNAIRSRDERIKVLHKHNMYDKRISRGLRFR